MRKMILALLTVTVMATMNAQAAIFHLRDVVLATWPTPESPVPQKWGTATGWFQFEGPFLERACTPQMCNGSIAVIDWDIKIRDIDGNLIDRITPTRKNNGSAVQTTLSNAPTPHLTPGYKTSFTFYGGKEDPTATLHEFNLFFMAGEGMEIERAVIPLGYEDRDFVVNGPRVRVRGYYQRAVLDPARWFLITEGYLQVNNNPPGPND